MPEDVGRCVAVDCPTPPMFKIVGSLDNGEQWAQLDRPGGEPVRCCPEHLPGVLNVTAGWLQDAHPHALVRTAAWHLYDQVYDEPTATAADGDEPAGVDANRTDRRRLARLGRRAPRPDLRRPRSR